MGGCPFNPVSVMYDAEGNEVGTSRDLGVTEVRVLDRTTVELLVEIRDELRLLNQHMDTILED